MACSPAAPWRWPQPARSALDSSPSLRAARVLTPGADYYLCVVRARCDPFPTPWAVQWGGALRPADLTRVGAVGHVEHPAESAWRACRPGRGARRLGRVSSTTVRGRARPYSERACTGSPCATSTRVLPTAASVAPQRREGSAARATAFPTRAHAAGRLARPRTPGRAAPGGQSAFPSGRGRSGGACRPPHVEVGLPQMSPPEEEPRAPTSARTNSVVMWLFTGPPSRRAWSRVRASGSSTTGLTPRDEPRGPVESHSLWGGARQNHRPDSAQSGKRLTAAQHCRERFRQQRTVTQATTRTVGPAVDAGLAAEVRALCRFGSASGSPGRRRSRRPQRATQSDPQKSVVADPRL